MRLKHLAWLVCATLAGLATASLPTWAEDVCTNKAAIASGTVVNSNPLALCDDGMPFGYLKTYNPPSSPPVPNCKDNHCTCCVPQMQQSYTQGFSCQGPEGSTTCQGGPKVYSGPTVAVDTTVECTGGQSNCDNCKEVGTDY